MSSFPDPNQVVYDDVIAVVERFCNEHRELQTILPGYEFEHIVFDDYNLEDRYIKWCTEQAGDDWLKEKLQDAPQDAIDLSAKEPWKRWAYDEIIQYRKDVLELFGWLLSVPEENRILYDDWADKTVLESVK